MSCETSARAVGGVARRNGVMGQVSKYLNTLGNWSTYRDLNSVEDIPERVGQVTAAFFGLEGLGKKGFPKLAGILGAVMAVQALEQVTGAGVTFGARLLGRGEPIGKYRGIILRKSPLTPRIAGAANRLTGGRLLDAKGYYFFESGRTWHSQTATVQVGDTPKTLTHVRSYSLPYREYYFDRELSPQTVVDVVKGDRDPDTVPGFIGGINELENATPLGGVKRAFFAANWLLIDEGERDEGGPGFVDYDALIKGKPVGSTSSSGYYQVSRAPAYSSSRSSWPSTTGQPISPLTGARTVPAQSTGGSPSQPYGTQYFRSGNVAPPNGDPYERIQDRYHAPNGQQYPLLVRGLKTSPITMTRKADAIYYDGEMKRWREIVDDEAQIALAKEVEDGRLKVTQDWHSHL